MLIQFNPLLLIFWVFVTSFIPGAILALAIFKDDKNLKLIEKILIGFGIGLIIPAVFAFLFNILGIKYSFTIAIASVALFYIISIAVMIKFNAHQKFLEDIKSIKISTDTASISALLPALFLVILLVSNYLIHYQAYSPIFQELDPYFYAYVPQQIITFGYNPLDDGTGWYPEVKTDHRTVPALAFMEAIWYSFYTQDGAYDNYMLSLVAGLYPAIFSSFIAFFVYLIVAAHYRRAYGLLAAFLISFILIFVIKLSAGEMEIQPYAFFALSFFFAMYSIMIKTKEKKYAFLAALAYAALTLGSSSELVAVTMLLVFIPANALVLYAKDMTEDIKKFAILNAIILFAGIVLFTGIIKPIYNATGFFNLSPEIIAMSAMLIFCAFLYLLKTRITHYESSMYALGLIVVFGFILFFFTPFGGLLKSIAGSGIGFAKFNYPLQRTIAEQGTSGGVFQDQLGFIALIIPENIGDIQQLGFLYDIINTIYDYSLHPFLVLFSFMGNLVMGGIIGIVNSLFDAGLSYSNKDNSILLTLISFFIFAMIYSLYKNVKYPKSEETLFLFFAAMFFPAAIIGILKAKFTIYLGYFLVIITGFIFGEFDILIPKLLKKIGDFEYKFEGYHASTLVLFVLALSMTWGQFSYNNFSSSLLFNAGKVRFQDDPVALQPKFKALCDQLKFQGQIDQDICDAGNDPIAYASRGTEYQYNGKLCIVSLYSDIFNPKPDEQIVASYRCNRLNDYWLESMEWIRDHTENDSRTTSWWDYGHWINFFGQRNTVLRNDHASRIMIGEVAHAYIDGSEQDLIGFMKAHDSKYVLFDQELVLGGLLGGKHGALNYLSCSRDNETTVDYNPGSSICEVQHRWELVYVPKSGQNLQPCMISEAENKTGIVAYGLNYTSVGGIVSGYSIKPNYCLGKAMLINGKETDALYYLDKTYPNGDLKLNKASINYMCDSGDGFTCQTNGAMAALILTYTKDQIWLENGEVKSGYEDRIYSGTHFYDSNLYKGFFLKQLDGFDLVFQSKGGEVKIYKMKG